MATTAQIASSTTETPFSYLLSLPPELRLNVLEHLLPEKDYILKVSHTG